MPNSLAVLMMSSWPLVTLIMYLRLPPQSAVIWSILAGYLVLPAAMGLDLPGLPGLSKHSIPSLFGYIYAMLFLGRHIPLFPKSLLGRVCAAVLLAGPFLTVATNTDPIYINSEKMLPALRPYDAASSVVGQLGWLCIWALAREFLRDAAALRQLGTALAIAFLWYSLPMLYEVRMSPQLHIMIYGFFQHDFAQMMRQGGFRPIVFLEHGLWVAILTSMAAMQAVLLARTAPRENAGRWYMAAAYLLAVLVLCKSMASLLYAVLLMPALLFLSGARLLRIARLLAILVLAYPVLRTLDVIPTDWLVEMAARFSDERAQSLAYRFDNEDRLLAHAMERPLFGWGGWERAFVLDPVTGRNTTVTDGLWVIAMGFGGFFGFLSQFGLLALPIFLLGRACRQVGREVDVLAGGMALILAANLIDLLPNATNTPVTWLMSGAMLGYLEHLRRVPDGAEATVVEAVPGARRPFAGLVGHPLQGPRSLL